MVKRTTNQFLLRLQKAVTNYEKDGFASRYTGMAKVAVQCSADTPNSYWDVVYQNLVLRINPASAGW
jgi:hypothetical protein